MSLSIRKMPAERFKSTSPQVTSMQKAFQNECDSYF